MDNPLGTFLIVTPSIMDVLVGSRSIRFAGHIMVVVFVIENFFPEDIMIMGVPLSNASKHNVILKRNLLQT